MAVVLEVRKALPWDLNQMVGVGYNEIGRGS